jgi:dolichol-phosphate mannosyltransferase
MGLREALTRAPSWVRWLLAFLPLRVAMVALVPVVPEEAYHWNFARHLDWGYLDHPPMIAWAIAAGRALFGDGPWGIRALPLLFSVGTTILLARLAKRHDGDAAASWAVILFTFVPVALPVSAAGFPDSPLFFFWTLTMTLSWDAIEGRDGRRWLAAGAALGGALLSKYTAVFLVVSVAAFLVLSARHRRWLATPWPYLAGVVALLVFSPVIYWNWKHDWASFLFQSRGRLEQSDGFRPKFALKFIWVQALAAFALTLPLMGAAVRRLLRTRRPEEAFFGALLLPPLLAFWAVSFFRPAHVLWPFPAYLGLIVVMAAVAAEASGRVGRFYARFRTAFVALCGAGVLTFGAHLVWFLPGFSPFQGPYGWEEVAARGREVRAGLPESAFYLAIGRKYTVASQLAYRLRRPGDVHSVNLLGEPALQYGYWCRPGELAGRDAVIVLEDPELRREAAMRRLRLCFDAVEPAGTVTVPVGRSTLRREPPLVFMLFRGRGYRPPPSL